MMGGENAGGNLFVFFLIAAAVTGTDLWSKDWADRTLHIGEESPVSGLPLTIVKPWKLNQGGFQGAGAAWGPRANRVFAGLNLAICFAILCWVFLHRRSLNTILTISLGLLLGGALGNLYDRLAEGGVRDFVRCEWGAFSSSVFNLADCAVCCGAILLLTSAALRRSRRTLATT